VVGSTSSTRVKSSASRVLRGARHKNLCQSYREHDHGGAVPPASDRIVSINLVRAVAVTPQLVGYHYGG